MAPPNNQKRVKGVQIYRPFVYGTTSKLFDPVKNPKPEGVPADHTHSWTVFVKGVDDADITYWCKKVTFKLHDSYANFNRHVEDVPPGGTYEVSETGWGEFEISIKLYYVTESQEKPQTIYHSLRLHPYGTDTEKEKMRNEGQIISWCYEEQLFNEPYEHFYEILTSPMDVAKGGAKATKTMRGGMVSSVGGRTVQLPLTNRPGQPYSIQTEKMEMKKLREAKEKVDEMINQTRKGLKEKEEELAALRQG